MQNCVDLMVAVEVARKLCLCLPHHRCSYSDFKTFRDLRSTILKSVVNRYFLGIKGASETTSCTTSFLAVIDTGSFLHNSVDCSVAPIE